MKRLVYIAFFVAVTAFAASCGQRAANGSAAVGDDTRSAASLVIDISEQTIMERGSDTVYLGRIRQGEMVARDIDLQNTTDKPFVITSIDLTCGCVAADYTRQPIMGGQSGRLTLTFDSAGLAGWVYKAVLVHTSVTGKPYTIYLTADIIQ